MEYVIIERHSDGNWLDPRPYLDRLPDFADALPPGARAYATHPGHYDFYGKRCVKDLKVQRVLFDQGARSVEIGFQHNCWKHEEDLRIRYDGVSSFTLAESGGMNWMHDRTRGVTLDEVLPHQDGCRHEIGLHLGSITVVSRDLTAEWAEADCPDK